MTQENTNGDTRSAAPSAQDRPQIPQHEVSIADLSKKILATDKQYDLSKILSAYQLAEKAHADQKRSSGEPYIIHPLAVADILLDLGMDPNYRMIVDRKNNLDTLEVQVEMNESLFSDTVRNLEKVERTIADALHSTLNIAAKITLLEPKSIQRSEGKAKRVIDKRSL